MKTLYGLGFLLLLVWILAQGFYLDSRLEDIESRLSSTASSNTVYVPAYSHAYTDGGKILPLETTLTIRNIDPKREVQLLRVDYYDTQGKLLRRYVVEEQTLEPLQSVNFIVEKSDAAGGAGANFIVGWGALAGASPPLVEAMMIGVDPDYSFSFVRSGVTIADKNLLRGEP